MSFNFKHSNNNSYSIVDDETIVVDKCLLSAFAIVIKRYRIKTTIEGYKELFDLLSNGKFNFENIEDVNTLHSIANRFNLTININSSISPQIKFPILPNFYKIGNIKYIVEYGSLIGIIINFGNSFELVINTILVGEIESFKRHIKSLDSELQCDNELRFQGDNELQFQGDNELQFQGDNKLQFQGDNELQFQGDNELRFQGDNEPQFQGDKKLQLQDDNKLQLQGDYEGIWF
jgi:hypothetical protein